MNSIIECNNLTHYYGKKKVFENLNFQVPKGKILGLLGRNGTGKTTTINILNGFLKPQGGECLVYGENSQNLSPSVKERIAFLMEGHIQYSFMNIQQIERFYSGFYPNWKKEAFYELMTLLQVTPRQKISTMSCGQRSQVALGLILAQDADLLILDDFSMGLDPGYRRLFIDYLREYAKAENKTIFTTSHIIQDMERLIDDVLIIGRNKVLARQSLRGFMGSFKQFSFELIQPVEAFPETNFIVNVERIKNKVELYTWESEGDVQEWLKSLGIQYRDWKPGTMTLEDAFIGLTGKY